MCRASATTARAIPRRPRKWPRPSPAVMLHRLGPKAWHRTPAEAMAVLEELEETARLWRLAQRRCPSLDEAALEELRQAFGASW